MRKTMFTFYRVTYLYCYYVVKLCIRGLFYPGPVLLKLSVYIPATGIFLFCFALKMGNVRK